MTSDDRIAALESRLAALEARVAKPLVTTTSVTVKDAATVLACSRRQVFRLIAAGRLRPAKSVGRSSRVTKASLEAVAGGYDAGAGKKGTRT